MLWKWKEMDGREIKWILPKFQKIDLKSISAKFVMEDVIWTYLIFPENEGIGHNNVVKWITEGNREKQKSLYSAHHRHRYTGTDRIRDCCRVFQCSSQRSFGITYHNMYHTNSLVLIEICIFITRIIKRSSNYHINILVVIDDSSLYYYYYYYYYY